MMLSIPHGRARRRSRLQKLAPRQAGKRAPPTNTIAHREAAARHGNSASREARREGDFVSSSPGRETPSSRDDDDDDGADAIASTDARATSDEAKGGVDPQSARRRAPTSRLQFPRHR